MIEIPESITIAKQLNETVKGKKIVQAQTEHTPHGFAFYSGDAEFYSTVMEGKRIRKRISCKTPFPSPGMRCWVARNAFTDVVPDSSSFNEQKYS